MSKIELQEFRLGDIFEKLQVKKAQKEELSKTPSKDFSVPVVYAKYGSNGIMYWGKKDAFTTFSNVISIVYNGVISAGKAYAQERETGVLAESYFIRLIENPDIPFEATFFIATVIEKAIYSKYSRENLATWNNKVENEIIKLPVINKDSKIIDFDYMKKYILSLQKDALKCYDSFITQNHLDNCDLSDDEVRILNLSPIFKEYRIGDIFKKLTSSYKGKGRKQDNVSRIQNEEFSLPLINCKDGDNGIMYYGRRQDFTSHKNVLSVIYNGPPTEGQTYYQEEIGLYTDAYIIGLKNDVIKNKEVGLYLATAINKSIHNLSCKKYSRGNKATWENKVENDKIYLPVDECGDIDWSYMELYIKAIEKRVMKNASVFAKNVKKMS